MAHVVITGGARGIGAATVESFAARGDTVYFLYEKSHAQAQALAQKTGATAIACDVSSAQAVRAAFEKIPEVDVLVCNAGICHSGLVQDLTESQWDRLFDVNVKGIFLTIQAAIPYFSRKHSGSIVTVSSMWGQTGAAMESAYSATKGAVIALTKALAQELGGMGVRVNSVSPGVVLTDMCAGYTESALRTLADQSPLGQNGTPQQIASAILYLADAEFVTGQILPVNGGFVI